MNPPKFSGSKMFKYFFSFWQEHFAKSKFVSEVDEEEALQKSARVETSRQYVAILQERFGDSWNVIFDEKNTSQQSFELSCAFFGEMLEELAIAKTYESISDPKKAEANAHFAAGILFAAGKINEIPDSMKHLFEYELELAQNKSVLPKTEE